MNKKRPIITVIMLLSIALSVTFSGQSMAATTTTISSFEFISSNDYNLIVGESSAMNFRLYDTSHNLFSGPITAYLWNRVTGAIIPLTVNGSGTYSASAVIDEPGDYALFVTDINGDSLRGLQDVIVRSAEVSVTGNLSVNTTNTLNAKLTDSDGNILTGKSVTVDGTEAGASSQTYTSLSDGTFTFSITPTQIGTIKFIHANHVIGTIVVSDQNVQMSVTGQLVMNTNSRLTVKLTDLNGNPIGNKSISVDATEAGLSSSSYTTLNDGTVTFTLTPTKIGSVNFIFGGRIVKTLVVQPAYTKGERVGGDTTDNSSLSVEVANKGWNSAENVIITRDDIIADSMVAVPLSKKLDAPVLMTPSDQLSQTVLAEIRNLKVQNVYIVGGMGAVSSNVENSLKQAGLNIIRFAGVDRYDTAAQVAAAIGSSNTAYLAYGYGEPDALTASAFAAEQSIPILLTETNALPTVTQEALQNNGIRKIKLLGGTGVISSELENRLTQQYIVTRYGGVDRFATEAAIFQGEFNGQSPLYFASALVGPNDVSSGKPFGDALMVAALAAKNNGFVVTLPPDNLPSPLHYFLLYNIGYIPTSTIVGNSSAINYVLETQLNTLLNH